MEEVNQLLDLANQMGLIKGLFEQTVHNKTKCSTWNYIYESHMEKRENVVLGFDAIRGMTILLLIGLSGALLVFVIEPMAHLTAQEQVVREIKSYYKALLKIRFTGGKAWHSNEYCGEDSVFEALPSEKR